MIVFRAMTTDDIPAGLTLCRLAGWNQLARDWGLFLQLHPDGCQVAIDDNGNVVGTVATLPYENHFTWIGMVLVNPFKRRRGIGTRLLQKALHLTATHETIKLDATPAGREVYLKLGFKDEYEVIRMRGQTISPRDTQGLARPLRESDLPSLQTLDDDVFGADRQAVLKWIFQGAPQYAFVVEEQGQIKGFCFGRTGYDFDQIGPIIAVDVNIATQLLSRVLHQPVNKPIVLDVLTHSPGWLSFVSSMGFIPLRPLTRMYRGANKYPGIPKKQFAILGPEFG